MSINDDSMTPRICSGDMLLIDTSQKIPKSGQIYAISADNELKVRRLHKRIDGGWVIKNDSASPEYPDETIHPEQLDCLRIIGRAIRLLMGKL